MKAYSYLRFSTPEQSKGDSYRRQTTLATEWCARRGVELDTGLTLRDLGVSAFRGRNARTGALRTFLDAVEEGMVEKGSYLLVENLDRISRDTILEAQALFTQIINAGITLVTLMDGRMYSRESVIANPISLFEPLIMFIRAREESQTKASRIAQSWANRRANGANRPMTPCGVAWLVLEGNSWRVLEDRAAVVRRIFDMAAQDVGPGAIAERLNRDRVPTFGRASYWQRSYVFKILHNPAVVGTMTPHMWIEEGGVRKRVPQDPIADYYPTIVDPDVFQKVQALAHNRRPLGGRHAGGPARSVVSGVGRCPLCGGTMTRVVKGGYNRPKLVCTKAKAGGDCTYKAVDYGRVEAALVRGIAQAVAEAPLGDDQMIAELDRIDGEIAGNEDALERLLDAVASGELERSPAVAQRIRETETELKRLREKRREALKEAAAHTGPMVERRLTALIEAFTAPLDVARANMALRQAVSAVVVNWQAGTLDLQWQHGGQSEVIMAFPLVET